MSQITNSLHIPLEHTHTHIGNSIGHCECVCLCVLNHFVVSGNPVDAFSIAHTERCAIECHLKPFEFNSCICSEKLFIDLLLDVGKNTTHNVKNQNSQIAGGGGFNFFMSTVTLGDQNDMFIYH